MRNSKNILVVLVLTFIFLGGSIMLNNVFASIKGFSPTNGVIPDEVTAVKVAEAIWLPIYGDSIYEKQPFVAEYIEKEGVWIVNGTLPENTVGGVPEIKIKKQDGRIIFLNHGK